MSFFLYAERLEFGTEADTDESLYLFTDNGSLKMAVIAYPADTQSVIFSGL